MAMLTGSFANSLAPGIKAVIGATLGGRESFYSTLYNVGTSDRNYEDFLSAASLPIAGEKPQGVDIQSYDALEGTTKRMTHKVYGIAAEVSQEMWEDDLYQGKGSPIRAATGEGIADSLAERVEVESHRPFNEGFTTTTNNGWPTVNDVSGTDTLFDLTHPSIAGGAAGTQANRASTDTDINVTAFRTGLTTFRKYTNDQGLRIPNYTFPSRLIVPPDLEYDAREIVNSSWRPDTANRVENVTKGVVTVFSDPYLTDTDAWFLQAPKHHLEFLWRWRPRFDSFDDRRARVAVFVGYERFSNYPIHWLGLYGSPGA